MNDDQQLISLGLVPRKSLGVRYYSVALVFPSPSSDEKRVS
ncbi:hypothetical protein [Lentzea tibetensis]|nr:hypothetical protein [Lentzea tibetensis]